MGLGVHLLLVRIPAVPIPRARGHGCSFPLDGPADGQCLPVSGGPFDSAARDERADLTAEALREQSEQCVMCVLRCGDGAVRRVPGTNPPAGDRGGEADRG